MNKEQVKDIMKVALVLNPGEFLSIEVPSEGQGKSLRTMFYRERLKVLQQGVAMNVSITSIEQGEDGKWIVIFTYEEPLVVTLHKVDGSDQEISLDNRITPVPDEEISEDLKGILENYRKDKEE